MKKVLIAGFAVAMACAVHADIYTGYLSSFGFEGSDGAGGSNAGPLLGAGEQAFVQLIYAGADGLVDGVAQAGGGLAGGDDVVIWSGLSEPAIAGDGNTEYGLFAATVGPVAGIAGGTVYGRIFQNAAAAPGSWYYEGHLQVMANFVPAGPLSPPSEEYDLGQGGAVWADTQVVPEPATIGLMGLAGLGLFLARRKAQR